MRRMADCASGPSASADTTTDGMRNESRVDSGVSEPLKQETRRDSLTLRKYVRVRACKGVWADPAARSPWHFKEN